MEFKLINSGGSRSFEADHPIFQSTSGRPEVIVIIGTTAGLRLTELADDIATAKAVLVELGTECLGKYTGEKMGSEGSNVLGFSRFRLGDSAATQLIELVYQPMTFPSAIKAAQTFFERHDLAVALCRDTPGRILDRLMRPYFNAALARLDDGLAPAAEIDRALRLGLGYPRGPIELLEETGLSHHYDISNALHASLDAPGFMPARRAQVAHARAAVKAVHLKEKK